MAGVKAKTLDVGVRGFISAYDIYKQLSIKRQVLPQMIQGVVFVVQLSGELPVEKEAEEEAWWDTTWTTNQKLQKVGHWTQDGRYLVTVGWQILKRRTQQPWMCPECMADGPS